MDPKIDLDRAAEQISARGDRWRARGLHVGPLTWRDQSRSWPDHVVVGRSQAEDPDSVGVRVKCGDEEGWLVLYDQGWVHIGYWAGDTASDVVDEVFGYRDSSVTQETFPLLLDRFGDRFHGRYGAKHGD